MWSQHRALPVFRKLVFPIFAEWHCVCCNYILFVQTASDNLHLLINCFKAIWSYNEGGTQNKFLIEECFTTFFNCISPLHLTHLALAQFATWSHDPKDNSTVKIKVFLLSWACEWLPNKCTVLQKCLMILFIECADMEMNPIMVIVIKVVVGHSEEMFQSLGQHWNCNHLVVISCEGILPHICQDTPVGCCVV